MTDALAALAAEIQACTRCPLYKGARQAVPGEGSAEAGILFLGEAPGYNEDVQGRPFVGAAGQLLDQLLAGIGLDRSKVFITNVVRHRPPENRDPLPDEIEACDTWFQAHVAALRPKVVVTLGRFAMYKFLPGESITRIHGKARRVADITVFPMFHPAAALHQPSLRSELEKDFQTLAAMLATERATEKKETVVAQTPKQLDLFG